MGIVEASVALGFASSNNEARKKIAEGAVRVNDQQVSDPKLIVEVTGVVKISMGKKRHGLLTP